jgi:hypothetical protein
VDFACEVFATSDDFIASNCDCGQLTPDEITELLEDASDLLAEMSGGKITGRCQSTLRPCRDSVCGWWHTDRVPSWSSWGTWNCCCGVDTLPLRGPVASIDLVTIDGIELPSGDYKLVDRTKLVRTDGGIWPGCQDLSLDSSEDGTFAVTYTFGRRPPVFARLAAVELACALGRTPDPALRQKLPGGTTFAFHQGVQVGFATRAGAQKDVAIDLPFVQQFLVLYGADAATGNGLAYAPEMYDGWSFHTE